MDMAAIITASHVIKEFWEDRTHQGPPPDTNKRRDLSSSQHHGQGQTGTSIDNSNNNMTTHHNLLNQAMQSNSHMQKEGNHASYKHKRMARSPPETWTQLPIPRDVCAANRRSRPKYPPLEAAYPNLHHSQNGGCLDHHITSHLKTRCRRINDATTHHFA